MAACPACGFSNPDLAKFCMDCAAPMAPATRAPTEQRRVVTIVFGDLVGFTARSETLDPEDVRAFLVPYYDLLTEEIERHGGVVDKLLGDGVMAVFGAPVAHEDDPERAVRMALRVLDRLPGLGLDLQLRFGINTGEVVVAIDAFERGDAITGDAANTASRLQGVAPIGGVVVGERTWSLTRDVFLYDELPPSILKGKAEPVRVFQVRESRGRLGLDVLRAPDSRLVGRAGELGRLTGLFDAVAGTGTARMALIVGEPGMGKSRLVAGLFDYVDSLHGTIATWHQGRCLPYGDGITFWALGEIVKAHAGILESDAVEVAAAKLEAVLPDDDERPWVRDRLLPLLGIEAAMPAGRDELYAAWRRFLAGIARHGPAVLVFEDLHWADVPMVAFLESFAMLAGRVPILIVGTARPELFDRYPTFGSDVPGLDQIDLAALGDAETVDLVATLLGTTTVAATVTRPILDGAGGNPLFAEQYVRLLLDQGLLARDEDGWALVTDSPVAIPASVQALLAARLDTLSSDARAVLTDASVVGKVFWHGAITAMSGRDPAAVVTILDDLARREFIRPAPRTSIGGEREFAFWHALTRDVAYAQLPRAARATRHEAVARWIETTAPDRVEDVADVLAYHYSTALELTRAAGRAAQAADLEASALRFLRLAGERALGLDTTSALASLERALALAPAGHAARPALLVDFSRAAYDSARNAEAAAALEEAVAAFREAGDDRSAAAALLRLSGPLRALGDPGAEDLVVQAHTLLAPLGPSRELIAALTERAGSSVANGRREAAIRYADEALEMARQLGLARPARALGFRGWARVAEDDPGWRDDFREAISLAAEAGDGRELALLHLNFANHLSFFEGPIGTIDLYRDGLAVASARGLTGMADWLRMNLASGLLELGEIDEAVRLVDDLAPRAEASGDASEIALLRAMRIEILLLRGDLDAAWALVAGLDEMALALEHDTDRTFFVSVIAEVRAARGDTASAAHHLEGIAASDELRTSSMYRERLCPMVRTALLVGDIGLAERLTERVEIRYRLAELALAGADAMIREARGDLDPARSGFARAATGWGEFGVAAERGHALFGEGRCLVALDRNDEARPVLGLAREVFAGLGAVVVLDQIDELLRADPAPAT